MTYVANAVDLSYSGISDAILTDPAIRLVVQCLWTGTEKPSACVSNVYKARAAGKAIAGYISLAPGHGGYWHVAQAHIGITDELWQSLVFRSIDVELDGLAGTEISNALAVNGPPLPRIIYTRRGFWTQQPYADRDFNALLWDARDTLFSPYGPWHDVAQNVGVQFAWDVDAGGASVDLDSFNLEQLGIEGSHDMPDSATDLRMKMAAAALNNDMTYLVNLLRIAAVVPMATPVLKAAL